MRVVDKLNFCQSRYEGSQNTQKEDKAKPSSVHLSTFLSQTPRKVSANVTPTLCWNRRVGSSPRWNKSRIIKNWGSPILLKRDWDYFFPRETWFRFFYLFVIRDCPYLIFAWTWTNFGNYPWCANSLNIFTWMHFAKWYRGPSKLCNAILRSSVFACKCHRWRVQPMIKGYLIQMCKNQSTTTYYIYTSTWRQGTTF